MLKTIDQAQKSIYLEMYIFLMDTRKKIMILLENWQKKRPQGYTLSSWRSFGSKALKAELNHAISRSQIEFIFSVIGCVTSIAKSSFSMKKSFLLKELTLENL